MLVLASDHVITSVGITADVEFVVTGAREETSDIGEAVTIALQLARREAGCESAEIDTLGRRRIA